MDEAAHRTVFTDWVDQTINSSKERAREFLQETGCLDRFRQLCHRQQQGNILPFVGAGMSVPSGFQFWGSFLKSLIPDAPHIQDEVGRLIGGGQYEEAAQLVRDTLGEGVITEEIHNRLGSHQNRSNGPVKLLPQIFTADVMTTNFDYVLSKTYEDSGNRFHDEICGAELRDAPRRMANDPHCLLRLHGAAESANGRVLTLEEYREHYENGGALPDVLSAVVGVRGFLFLGCSLQSDRTYSALCDLRTLAQVEPSPHYAFLSLPEEGRLERRQFLAEAGIHPIYYPVGEHDQSIEDLLITMHEGGLADD